MNPGAGQAGAWPGASVAALLIAAAFAAAFGYFEAGVEIYLRKLYYPAGFDFPLQPLTERHLMIEVAREVFAMVTLIAFARFAGRRLAERFAVFCFAFAVWDLSYYLWLKVLWGWPSSLLAPDLLYLIPVPWIGPVLSPLLVSAALLFGSLAIMHLLRVGGRWRPGWREWAIAVGGAALIVLSYTSDLEAGVGRAMPDPYRWDLLVVGMACGFYALARSLQKNRAAAQPQ